MSKIDITTTTAYADALKVEAKKAKKSVEKLGPTAKLRAEAAAWKVLQAVGEAVSNVIDINRPAPVIVNVMPEEAVTGFVPVKNVVKMKKAALPRTTKRTLAAIAFADNLGERRKDVIAAMMDTADLSKAGAATYYQNFKSGKWVGI